MARAVAEAVGGGRHLVVRAGTGTGKTLGYLVPAVLSGKRTVVATATRALQDQLAAKDLPVPRGDARPPVHLGRPEGPVQLRVRPAAGRGRPPSGPVRRAGRARDRRRSPGHRGRAAGARRAGRAGRPRPSSPPSRPGPPPPRPATAPSSTSSPATPRGPRSAPPPATARARRAAPAGDRCFAEAARARAAEADVVVVNLHLYGLDLASDGAILPEHDLTVIDEAHVLDDIDLGHHRRRDRRRAASRTSAGCCAASWPRPATRSPASSTRVPCCPTALAAPPRPAAHRPAARRARPARWPRCARRVEAAQTALRGIPDGAGRRRPGPGASGPARRPRPCSTTSTR